MDINRTLMIQATDFVEPAMTRKETLGVFRKQKMGFRHMDSNRIACPGLYQAG
jgi:hypothetical protein